MSIKNNKKLNKFLFIIMPYNKVEFQKIFVSYFVEYCRKNKLNPFSTNSYPHLFHIKNKNTKKKLFKMILHLLYPQLICKIYFK